jgi:hypothetical protein
MKNMPRLVLLIAVSWLFAAPPDALARAVFKRPPGTTVMTVDGASYGYPGTKVSYIYYSADSSVFGVVGQVKIPAKLSKNFRSYGKELERTYKALDGRVKVTVRRNTYIIRGSLYGSRFYAKGVLKGRTVYSAGGHAQTKGPKQRAVWKMIDGLKIR